MMKVRAQFVAPRLQPVPQIAPARIAGLERPGEAPDAVIRADQPRDARQIGAERALEIRHRVERIPDVPARTLPHARNARIHVRADQNARHWGVIMAESALQEGVMRSVAGTMMLVVTPALAVGVVCAANDGPPPPL